MALQGLRTRQPTQGWRTSAASIPPPRQRPTCLEFFAGSGLVTEALRGLFDVVWANDVSPKKAEVYRANHPDGALQVGRIEDVSGRDLPHATLSWASFPCQDLSLAGNLQGIGSARSGLVWHWLRVMDEMRRRPRIIVAENVTGLVSADGGRHYLELHAALAKRGYRVGAMILDAKHWVPQSRPRVFLVGRLPAPGIHARATGPSDWLHPPSIRRAADLCRDWIWWTVPPPRSRPMTVDDIVEWDAPCDPPERAKRNLSLIPPLHRRRLRDASSEGRRVFPAYKRTRSGRQVLELRFDGVAGCLRTPEGGSSRQLLIIQRDGRLFTRLITVREALRLMGVRDSYRVPGSYNDAYKALGDAVAVPAVRHLARHLLAPLANSVLLGRTA